MRQHVRAKRRYPLWNTPLYNPLTGTNPHVYRVATRKLQFTLSILIHPSKSPVSISSSSSMIANILRTIKVNSIAPLLKNYCTKLFVPAFPSVRYTVMDKWNLNQFNETIPNFTVRRPMENVYKVKKNQAEQKKCFRQIEDVKRQYFFPQTKCRCTGLTRETFYDTQKPEIWKTVRGMYAPNDPLQPSI